MAVLETAGERNGLGLNPLVWFEALILVGYESVKYAPSLLYASPLILIFGLWRLRVNGKTDSEE